MREYREAAGSRTIEVSEFKAHCLRLIEKLPRAAKRRS